MRCMCEQDGVISWEEFEGAMTKWIAAPRKRSSMGDDEPGSPVVKSVCRVA